MDAARVKARNFMKRCIYHGVEIGRDGRCPRCAAEEAHNDAAPTQQQSTARGSASGAGLRTMRDGLSTMQVTVLLIGVVIVTVLATFGTLKLMGVFGR